MLSNHVKGERTIVLKPENLFRNDKVNYKIRRKFTEKGIIRAKFIEEHVSSENMESVLFLNDRLEIVVDTTGYRPEDLRCELKADSIIVTAQSRVCADDTETNFSMSKSYELPQDVIPNNGHCSLSQDGTLIVTAPWKR